jgi:hypothetical protein
MARPLELVVNYLALWGKSLVLAVKQLVLVAKAERPQEET